MAPKHSKGYGEDRDHSLRRAQQNSNNSRDNGGIRGQGSNTQEGYYEYGDNGYSLSTRAQQGSYDSTSNNSNYTQASNAQREYHGYGDNGGYSSTSAQQASYNSPYTSGGYAQGSNGQQGYHRYGENTGYSSASAQQGAYNPMYNGGPTAQAPNTRQRNDFRRDMDRIPQYSAMERFGDDKDAPVSDYLVEYPKSVNDLDMNRMWNADLWLYLGVVVIVTNEVRHTRRR